MSKLNKIKLGNTTYDIGTDWENITNKPDYAPAIQVVTEERYDTNLSSLTDIISVIVKENTLSYPYLLLSKGENLLLDTFNSLSVTGEKNGVTVEFLNNNSVKINGTCTGDFWINFKASENTFSLKKEVKTNEKILVGAINSGTRTSGRPYFSISFRDSSGTSVFSVS